VQLTHSTVTKNHKQNANKGQKSTATPKSYVIGPNEEVGPGLPNK